MKYIVEVTSSNPSHEHVSLRKVQKKTSFVVEAASEAEALNRARGKFRSLGHYVHNVALAEKAQDRPVPNPYAVPKTPAPGKEEPAIPGHPLEAERAKVEAEVEKRRLELEKQAAAKKAAEKAAAPKNEETEISEKISLGSDASSAVKAKEKISKDMEDKEDTAVARISKSVENTKDSNPEYSKRVAAFKDAYLKKKKAADAGETELNIKEGFDTDPKDIAAYLIDRHGKGKVTMDHIEAYERRRDSHRPIEKHEVMKYVKKMSEEVEQIEEAKFSKTQTKMAHTIGKEFKKKKVGDPKKGGPFAVATAMVRDRPAAAKKAYKTILAKEEVAPVNEIVRIASKIVGAAIKKGADDVVKAKPTVAVGTEKTAAKAAELTKADTTFKATGGARVPDVKSMDAETYKAYYKRQRALEKSAKEPKAAAKEGPGPETPPPAAPGARVVPLQKPARAVSVKASQNPYMAVANEAAETTTTKTTIDDKMGKPLPPRKPSSDTDPGLEKKKTAAAEKMINAARGKVNRVNTKPTMDVNLKDKK